MQNNFIAPPIVQGSPKITVCYQMTTRNKSFLEMHYYLKKKGVINNAFMLQLLDPDLAGIDPHDPLLSRTMKLKIQRECIFNFWYYIREVVRVSHSGSPKGIPFILHRGNLAMFFCMLQNINTFIELPRQQGKTFGAAVFYSWSYNFGTSNSEFRFMNKDLGGSKDNLAMVKNIIEMIPSYLQMTREYTMAGDRKKKGIANVETMSHIINKNIIKTVSSARSRTAAGNLLRGKTITFWWMDEWAFVTYNDAIYLSTYPAVKTAFDNARSSNKPYGILITTTPGVLSTNEGKYAFEMKEDSSIFSETWYDKTPIQIHSILDANQKSDFVYIRYTYKQLGRDEKWFYEICKGMQWRMRDIRREVLLEWTDMPENCPFAAEDLEDIEKKVHEPINKLEFFDRYILNIYKPIPLNRNYIPKFPPIIGVDVSGGYRRDASAITIIDSLTTEVIADFNSNHISPIDLARLVLEITTRYYPNAVINVERNGGFGTSVIAKLKESSIKKNLYFEIKDREIEEQTDGIRIRKKKMLTKVFGLDSTKDVRENLIEILRERVLYHKDKFNSPTILNEMKQMEIKRSGKVEHSDNSHDDQVFSYLMALYVWYDGKNLKENFNIMKQNIKIEGSSIDDTITALDNKFVSVIDEVVGPAASSEEDERNEKIQSQLAEIKHGQGIMFDQFIKRREKEEEDMFKMLLRSKPVLDAYCKQKGISEEEAKQDLFDGETDIPDSIFLNFNSDTEMEQEEKLKKNFNMLNYPVGK